MSAATYAAIGIAVYPAVMSAYLFVSSDRIRWDMFFAVTDVLRSHTGGSEEADPSHPQGRSAPSAGVERGVIPHSADAPPAPCRLAGAGVPQPPAPARPPRVMVHG